MKDGWNPYNTKGSSHRIFIRISSEIFSQKWMI